jgi:3-oxoacyl-(acyl-carrier-protein) synthase
MIAIAIQMKPSGRAGGPFSIDRRGFVASEGAGCMIIPAEEFAATRAILELRLQLGA